jgi:hypothetical protein
MRLVGIVVAMMVLASSVALTGTPSASDKPFKLFVGKVVISPDTPPGTLDELPAFLKINLSKDNAYDVTKGPPWPFHLVGVLAKDLKKVTLVIADKDDKKLTPLLRCARSSSRTRRRRSPRALPRRRPTWCAS